MNNSVNEKYWFGDAPKHWEIKKIASLYKLRNEKVSDKDYPPLSVSMKGIVPQLDSVAKTNDGDNRKLVCKGDFAINSRSDRRGSCGISDYDGSVSLINTVLQPRKNMHPKFYDWFFHTTIFADEFYRWGHGIVDDLWTTGWQDMKRISILYPPIEEQKKIADFLDEKCAEIDGLIKDLNEEILTLEEYKQSVITELVCNGVDFRAQKKNSGVDWVKEIPDSWNIDRLKLKFDFGKGLSITKENLVENGVPVISYGQIHSKDNNGTSITENLIRYVSENYLRSSASSLVSKNDFIFADTSEDLTGCGNCVYVDCDYPLFAGYHTIIVHPKTEINTKYYAYLFKTDCWRSQIRQRVSGIKLFSITQKILKETSIITPPIEEQMKIVEILDEKSNHIDSIISQKKEQISILEQYKKTIIYEYTTGKKEVV